MTFCSVNGAPLLMPSGRRAYYRPDFEVTHIDGRTEYVDVKGRQDTADVAYKLPGDRPANWDAFAADWSQLVSRQ
jgi:hypothetical protein